MKTMTAHSLTISKLSCFLSIIFIFISNTLSAQVDSLDYNIKNVVYECQRYNEVIDTLKAWHQTNMNKLRTKFIGQEDIGKIIRYYSIDLENPKFPPQCNPCKNYVTYSLIDTIERRIIFDKAASFTIQDTSPPTFLDVERFDTIECKYSDPITIWNEGKAAQIRSQARDCSTITFPFGSYQEEIPSQNEKMSSARYLYEISDIYGNSDTISIILTVLDTTPPATSCDPDDLIIECNGLVQNELAAKTWNDENIKKLKNCSREYCSNISVTSDFDFRSLSDECGLTGFTPVTYTIVDDFRNRVTKTATFTIIDISYCKNITIQSTNNQLNLSNLTSPNIITKVFDPNWQIIYNCSGDCPEIITIPDLITGKTYHTDVQFYDKNWQFLCEDKQDIVIEGRDEPCDTSICAGDVILQTQAEVDAFCGCEVIKGNLEIGNLNTNIISDINSLATLSSTKKVLGNLIIARTRLKNISGLENLEETKTLIIENCDSLMNLNALKKLKTINLTLKLGNNASLNDITGIKTLRKVQNILLSGCPIRNLTVFANLENTTLNTIDITNSQQLLSLDGFQNITRLENESGSGGITLGGNKALIDISALSNLVYSQKLIIADNDKLENCCAIAHLLDEDETNGTLIGQATISKNSNFCNSPEAILQNCQILSPSTCKNIQALTQNNQIIIEGLTAPNEILKVFDKDYNIVYQCVANCEERQVTDILPAGNYIVDLQLYDENWQQICFEQKPIILGTTTSIDCKNILISTETGQIRLANITAPNSIVKVFDPNWQIMFECTANCKNEIVLPVDKKGLYHTDVQLYDENWVFLCEDKQNIIIEDSNGPCDTSICAGDVILRTQAEVDAFCGCEVIEGDLDLGPRIGDIQKFERLKEVKGDLILNFMFNLKTLDGLNNLEEIGGTFYLYNCQEIKNLEPLSKLKKIDGNIDFYQNLELTDIAGLRNLKFVNGIAVRKTPINSTSVFSNLEVTKLNSLLFSECTNLTNVNGFEKIDSILIFGGFHGYFGFVSNTSLSSLEGIRNVKYVEGTIDVFNNTQLEECCVISHLVKNPHDNQYITFERNGGLCNHSYLLDSCNINTQFSCEDINLTTEDELSITNITAPITILKVFDANYTTVYDCYADCEDSINIPDLATGTYHININFYNENWQSICEYNKTIEIEDTTQSRNSKFSPSDFALFPNPAKAETFIDLSKIKGDAITLNLYNQLGQQVWTKDIDEVKLNRERIDLADFQNGLYFLKIQTKSRKLIVKKLMISRLY